MVNTDQTRRRAMQAMASLLATSSAGLIAGSSKPIKDQTETKLLTGTPNDPITTEEVQTVQRDAVETGASAMDGGSTAVVGGPNPDKEGRYVSFYALKMDSAGKPIAHIGYGFRDQGEDERQKKGKSASTMDSAKNTEEQLERAKEVKQVVESASSVAEYRAGVSDGKTATASAMQGGSWDFGGAWAPYGVVGAEGSGSGGEFNLSAQPAGFTGNTNRDSELWAATGYYVIKPEIYISGGLHPHVTDEFKVEQKMGAGVADVDYIAATKPSGDEIGEVESTSVSFGVDTSGDASGSITLSYSQPDVDRYEKTDSAGDRDQAAWKYYTNSAEDERIQVSHGSLHWIEDEKGCPKSDSYRRINVGETELHVAFDNWGTQDSYDIDANWYGWVC